jgi:aryl-alcohol dehydrogenase-like predicted oxidoreductase
MEYVPLGNTGLKVSRICLGCMSYGSTKWRDWVLEEQESIPFFRQALDAGINFFDTADIYSLGASEEVTGRALKKLGVKREQVVIATKVNNPMGETKNERGTSKKHIRHAIDASLKRLGVDYVDLYQIHRYDSTTPMQETLEALTDVVNQGKALYIGASSMYAWEFARFLCLADRHGYARFVSMQNHYNLVYREEEREMIPLCRAEGIGLIPWSPLARGFLAGNRRSEDKGETVRAKSDEFAHGLYYKEDDFQVVANVTEIAKKRGVSNAQIALAWILHQPGVTSPIIGATKPHHIEDAIKGAELRLSHDELAYLAAPYKPHRILGH